MRASRSWCYCTGGAQNAHTWDIVALALNRPLVGLDLPGHGHSDWWPDHLVRGARSPVVDAADVAELRRRGAQAVVVDGAGHSFQGDRPLELAALIRDFVFPTE